MDALERLKYDAPRILDKYPSGQQHKAIEEMAELTVELCKVMGGKFNQDKVREEIADVLVMAYQMRYLYGSEQVDEIIHFKLDRTLKKLYG